MTASVERRFTPGQLTARSTGSNTIGGYAAVFRKLSQNLGGFVEELTPTAFNKARSDGWQGVICRFNHDDIALLGTTHSGSLRLSIDQNGLEYEVDPPQARADIVELVQRGDISKSSFAFIPVEDDWSLTDQGFPKRSLLSLELVDVAPVVSPAYLDTTAAVRSLADKMSASYEEVRSAADANELTRFFVRTDNKGKPQAPKKKVFGPSARMNILARKEPDLGGK